MNAFPYLGGKVRLSGPIMAQFPYKFNLYCEPFCGSGAVFFAAAGRHAEVEILNDINGDLINFFHQLRDNHKKFIERLQYTPHGRGEYREAYERLRDGNFKDDCHRAICFFVASCQSFSTTAAEVNKQNSWSFPDSNNPRADQWKNYTDPQKLKLISERLREASIENYPAQRIFKLYDKPGTLFYIDPHYLNTHYKGSANYHGNTLSEDDHRALIETFLKIKGFCILSGYEHQIYDLLDQSGWARIKIKFNTQIAAQKETTKTKERLEILWINPALQKAQMNQRLF